MRLCTLEAFPRTGLSAAMKTGEFIEASEEQVVREILTIVEQTDSHMEILSDSASNLIDISGRLPHDRSRMLRVIDEYHDLPEREKLIFSLSSRLRSFIGQYGGVSDDIVEALRPYLKMEQLTRQRHPMKSCAGLRGSSFPGSCPKKAELNYDYVYLLLYYRGLRRPLCLQSRQSLPFMLAVLAYGFPLKDASHAEDHAFKHG